MDFSTVAERTFQIPAQPASGLWTRAIDDLTGPALLRLEATGTWRYGGAASCGPDGDPGSLMLRERMLYTAAPVGALIGKIGGSTAGWNDGTLFLAGAFVVYKVAKDAIGPLYLTINDEYGGMANNYDTVTVLIRVLPLPVEPQPAPGASA